jgi:hypothetical protein
MGTVNRNMEIPPPPPGAPGMFRCCKPGLMETIFSNAGFTNVKEEEVLTRLNAGTTDTYWTMMTEIAAPFVSALSKADDKLKEKVKNEVYQLVQQKFPQGNVAIDASAIVVSAEKERP